MTESLRQSPATLTTLLISCESMLSCFSRVRLFMTPQTVACQAPLSAEFSRQEYWSGFPFPPPRDLPKRCLLHLLHRQVDSLPLYHLGSPMQSKKFKENKRKIKDSLNTMKVKLGEVVLISGKVGFKGKIDYLFMFTSWKIVQ